MRRETERDVDRHLTEERLEALALGEARARREAEHLRRCAACRREVAFLRTLDRELSELPHLEPAPDFPEAVMARVHLPTPWHEMAWQALRRRWLALSLSTAAALATVGAAAWWLFGRQGLTPRGLAAVALEGARELGMQALLTGGRVLYDLGLLELGGTVWSGVSPVEALLAVALFSLTGLVAGAALVKLSRPGRPLLGGAAGT